MNAAYIIIILSIILALGIVFLPKILPRTSGIGQTMAVNVTKLADGCRITWLGGTDYDSFVRDLSVNNVSIGHPEPGSVIYEGRDCNMTVSMYFRDVRAYQTIWPVVNSAGNPKR